MRWPQAVANQRLLRLTAIDLSALRMHLREEHGTVTILETRDLREAATSRRNVHGAATQRDSLADERRRTQPQRPLLGFAAFGSIHDADADLHSRLSVPSHAHGECAHAPPDS